MKIFSLASFLPDEVVSFLSKLRVLQICYEIDEIPSNLKNHKKREDKKRNYERNAIAVVLRRAKRGQAAYCE